MTYRSRIIGTGSGFPEKVMANSEFETFVDTSDEWIRTRTGIQTRRIADRLKGETTLSLALEASRRALEMADVAPEALDLIIVGTVTPDTIMPSTANLLQAQLGNKKAFGFDLQAACSGFVYGMSVADHFLRLGTCATALVVGAETLSTVTNWRDRATCVLFGDGAGAAVLKRVDASSDHAILGTRLYSDGSAAELLNISHGYGRVPPYAAEYRQDQHKIKMQGAEVFKLATRNMIEAATNILKEHDLGVDDVDLFIFHQANIRIIDHCAEKLGVDRKKMWVNVHKYGNTSAATMPVVLDEAWRAGAVKPGQLILMATFGGGLTWGAALIRL